MSSKFLEMIRLIQDMEIEPYNVVSKNLYEFQLKTLESLGKSGMKIFNHGDNAIDVVCAVIFNKDEDKILVGKRSDTKQWEFPGGKVEDGETYETAIVRELKEELDSEVEILLYFGCDSKYVDGRIINLYTFITRFIKGNPQPVEHDELRWVSKEEIDTIGDWIESESLLNEVKQLMRY